MPIEDERGLSRGTDRRDKKGDRLLTDPRGVIGQLHGVDQLVTCGREVSPERSGIGPRLNVAVLDGGGLYPGPRMKNRLIDRRPFG